MTTSIVSRPLAKSVRFEKSEIIVFLNDGREIRVPLEWFPRLRDAKESRRKKWRLIGGGVGIHWPDLDEDISTAGLLSGISDRTQSADHD